jgi:SAM-dependent methyltransferase
VGNCLMQRVVIAGGEPALTAARRVGPADHVVATDISPEVLAVAAERAASQGVTNIAFLESDAECLAYPESCFDAVLCRGGLMFLSDLAGTLRRLRRMLVPGGRLAAAVWDTPPRGSPGALAFTLAREMFQLPNPARAKGAPQYGLAGNALDQAVAEAGFAGVRREVVPADMVWPSTDAWRAFVREMFPGRERAGGPAAAGAAGSVLAAVAGSRSGLCDARRPSDRAGCGHLRRRPPMSTVARPNRSKVGRGVGASRRIIRPDAQSPKPGRAHRASALRAAVQRR